ncbi:hypothetical protein [Wukongibacter sp. M2B1]
MTREGKKICKLLATTAVFALSITALVQLSYTKKLSQWRPKSIC